MTEKTNIPHWIRDITSYVGGVPYGDVTLTVKRIERKTTEVTTISEETLRYVDNQEALHDLNRLFENLIDAKFTGDAQIRLSLKDGQIQLIGVFNTKKTKY